MYRLSVTLIGLLVFLLIIMISMFGVVGSGGIVSLITNSILSPFPFVCGGGIVGILLVVLITKGLK